MNRLLPVLLAGAGLLTSESAALARSHRSHPAPTSAAAPTESADGSLRAESASAAPSSAAPAPASVAPVSPPPPSAAPPVYGPPPPPPAVNGAPLAPSGAPPGIGPPPTPYGAPPGYGQPGYVLQVPAPLPVPIRTRPYWELSAIGGITLGAVYLASVLAGSISYAGFYQGQWGFFVPLVGPALTLGNVGGQVCPCFASQLYAYGIGTVLSIATIGAIVPIILGGVLTKKVPLSSSSKVQLAPTLARDAGGFQLVGRF